MDCDAVTGITAQAANSRCTYVGFVLEMSFFVCEEPIIGSQILSVNQRILGKLSTV